jgi:hypothetical protein
MSGIDRAKLKTQICAAFGVTEEEVDEIDRAMAGPQARAERARLEEIVMTSYTHWQAPGWIEARIVE